ncbi:uncharacterized protein LOC110725399 [Chenopodium quinoa]|uniref:uncharacterized protein LOC110725399 n=1 Tax=Chenopodium quinoa TaxID=63459 RepID=UPI000B796202|nr:uncharacterized protein LOC110725399 [Chenopodium quinoa]
MGENPPQPLLRDYDHPNAFQLRSGIRLPTTNANNFELSPQLIRMIQSDQFGGSPHECPFAHLDNFLELCTTIKQNNISEEFIRMHMFQFSLRDKAKHWLRTVEEGSLSTWDEVTRAFLGKYCPPEKTAELRRKITNFNQEVDETLSEAWERFKDYTRACPHHGFTSWIIVQSFYDGLTPTSRANLDSGAGGSLKKLSVDEAYKMIEEVAKHYAYGGDKRQGQPKKGGKHDLEAIDLIASKVDMLARKLDQVNNVPGSFSPQVMSCETCGGNDHLASYCNTTTEHVASLGRNDPYSQTFNQGWKQHPNFGWKQPNQAPPPQNNYNQAPPYNQPPTQQQAPYRHPNQRDNVQQRPQYNQAPPPPKSNIESVLETFMTQQIKINGEVSSSIQQLQAHNKMIESQLSQIAQQVGCTSNPGGQFPSTTVMNPKEQAKSITLIMEGGYETPIMRENVAKKGDEGDSWVDESEFENEVSEEARGRSKMSDEGASKRDEGEVKSQAPFRAYEPHIPFPHRMIEKMLNEKLSKFLDEMEGLQSNIPLLHALSQMPTYAKFLKNILSNKSRLEESDSISLPTEISAIPQNELPENVSLMPHSMAKRLNLGEISPTKMSIQLADRSVKVPLGVLKDIPIQVGKVLVPCDFVIMEMDEDFKIPLILGRPFLKTAGVNIDMKKGRLTLHVGHERISFSFPETLNDPMVKQVHRVDVLVNILKEDMEESQDESTHAPEVKKQERAKKKKKNKIKLIDKMFGCISSDDSNVIILPKENGKCVGTMRWVKKVCLDPP